MSQKIRVVAWLALITLVAMAWKVLIVANGRVPFNSDEAIVGLMARHILQGNWPVFFYGQSYMGSLDAILVAAGFLVLGESVWVIRLVQSLLYAGLLLTTFWLGSVGFQSVKVGLISALFLAIPTVNMTLYTTASLGGYGEALLIGNLLLILAIKHSQRPRARTAFLWGILAGVGLWANGLTLVFSLPSLIYLLAQTVNFVDSSKIIRRIAWIVAGGLIGATPWWIYAVQQGPGSLFLELLGSAVSVEQAPWIARTGMHLVNLVLLGLPVTFGLRPPWSVEWLALPLIPLVLVAWSLVLLHLYRSIKFGTERSAVYRLLSGVGLTLCAGFLFTAFGVDPSGRYFLPLATPLALIAADFTANMHYHRWLRSGVLGSILVFQLVGNIQCALRYPPGFTTQFYAPTIIDHQYDDELIAFLSEQGETRGYTHYWVSYPLAFLSGERLIFTPRLSYHLDLRYTARDDRYAPYRALVDASERVAYITTHNPALDDRLKQGFHDLEVTWLEESIGDYHVFYQLSRVVSPEELGLGLDSP